MSIAPFVSLASLAREPLSARVGVAKMVRAVVVSTFSRPARPLARLLPAPLAPHYVLCALMYTSESALVC